MANVARNNLKCTLTDQRRRNFANHKTSEEINTVTNICCEKYPFI